MKIFTLSILLLFTFISCVAQSQNSTIERTQIKIYMPFALHGLNPKLTVAQHVQGSCWTQSIATARSDAWRCTAGNAISDPCFVNYLGKPDTLVCSKTPWNSEVTLLQLNKPLPNIHLTSFNNFNKAQPWIIELANGQRCEFLTGATAPIAGMRMNYGCGKNTYIVGDIDKTSAVWQAYYFDNENTAIEQVAITNVWF